MVLIKLQGGLGNQMFQYAVGFLLARKNKTKLVFDLEFFNDQEKRLGFTPRQFELSVFNPDYETANRELINSFSINSTTNRLSKIIGLPFKKTYYEQEFGYDENVMLNTAPIYLEGYFQSEKYFMGEDYKVRELFNFPLIENVEVNIFLKAINNSNAVGVHFRRGDYIADELTHNFHGVCSLEYYLKAIQILSEQVENPKFFVFSDELDWVEGQINEWHEHIIFVKLRDTLPSWVDMMLMSSCKHQIIANSSYSWWAAWLNSNVNKRVIAPKTWFNDNSVNTLDLIPPDWICL